jgi:hypothetical protein
VSSPDAGWTLDGRWDHCQISTSRGFAGLVSTKGETGERTYSLASQTRAHTSSQPPASPRLWRAPRNWWPRPRQLQAAFWDALSDLEDALKGIEVSGTRDLSETSIDELIGEGRDESNDC